MPALSQARERAKTSSCANNLKALCFAMQQYADNNNGRAKACTASDKDSTSKNSSLRMLGPASGTLYRMTLLPYLSGSYYASGADTTNLDMVKTGLIMGILGLVLGYLMLIVLGSSGFFG